MANRVICEATGKGATDDEGLQVYSDLKTWDENNEDYEFNKFNPDVGGSEFTILLRMVNVAEDQLEATRKVVRDKLDQLMTDYGLDGFTYRMRDQSDQEETIGTV